MTCRLLPALISALLLAACSSTPPVPVDADARMGATFIVVRHAEKVSDRDRDPDLSDAGLVRARALAGLLADVDLAAIFTTDYRRTRQTVQPAADAHGLLPATYDATTAAAELAGRLRDRHAQGTVLVAGHSNTVPDIVAALCACNVEPMPETEYDRLSTIRIAADGSATLEVTRYGARAHAP